MIRIPWWYMNSVVYIDDTPPAIAVQVLNRLAMLFLFLAQSYYLHTWLVLLQLTNAQRWRKVIQILFSSIDVVVSLTIITFIIIVIFDKSGDYKDYGYKYQIGVQFIGTASLVTSLLFTIIGSIILIKFRRFILYQTQIGFIVVAGFIFLAGFSRFICLFYKKLFGKMMDNTLFAILCYLLPDLIPCTVITIMQLIMVINKSFTYGPLVTESLNQMLMAEND
ncbi:Conserved_hypothetical protein [Hexamita inflata]|uniref:Uncharacterized protein n=1 Tax=Hexamita inflata TaxID=28002 RepID=A0AA86U9M4_9EUKA|nr:Conserved hypothetical protein [Hexamita inflata]